MNLPFDFGLNLDSAQQMEMHISGTHDTKSRVFSRIERIDSLAQFGDQSIQSTITINEGHDTSNHLLIQGVKLLINTVGQFDTNHNNLYTFFSSNPDTAILTNIFHQFIEQNYNAFSVSWQSIDESQSSGKGSNGIVYASFLFEEPFGVVVTNYFYYLLKSISAQIVFAFILLLITAVAFRLAYINLKNQRKLLTIKNEFISNITHELKTPVSTVKVALEALLDFNLRNDPKRTKEYLEMAHSEMDRLDLLVNQVLKNSVLEDNSNFLSIDNFDIVSLVREVSSSMQSRFDQQNAIVEIKTSKDEIFINADRLHLHGVIVNLLDNSLKYTEQKPEILIDIKQDLKETSLTITDNGIGIPDEYVDKIFDKFFRVPKGDQHNVKGYGLGLNYASLVMKLHNGKITVKSKDGSGCSFTLHLPGSKISGRD